MKTFSQTAPCMIHIADKPVVDPGAKSLHQAWMQCREFAGLSDDEVHYGLVSALHVLWKSCRSGVPAAPADAAEAAFLLASIEWSDGDIINLEPIDILYLMEFHRLYKPGKPSSAVRMNWPSASIPSMLRDQFADKDVRLSLPFLLPGGTRTTVNVRVLPGQPRSQRLDDDAFTHEEAAAFSRHKAVFLFYYPKDKFQGLLLPPLEDFAEEIPQILSYYLDYGAISAVRLFEKQFPGGP